MFVNVQDLTFKGGIKMMYNTNNDYTDSNVFVAPQKYSDPKAKYGVSIAKKKQAPPK